MARRRKDGIVVGDIDHKMQTRSKARGSKKCVKFVDRDADANRLFCDETRSPAARSLFSVRCILELPTELVTLIMRYFNAKELMLLRCVCQDFACIINNNKSIWKHASYQNMWPAGNADVKLFERGAQANNTECLIKLGLDSLYHFNLKVVSEKTKKEIRVKASYAAQYFQALDDTIAPKKPLTWMLIRPPWSSSVKMICLKQAIYQQLQNKVTNWYYGSVGYNIGKIKSLEHDGEVAEPFFESNYLSHAVYEKLLLQKTNANNDTGLKLQWLRNLHECAVSGNVDASFELASHIITNKYVGFVSRSKATSFCASLFQNSRCLGFDKLEQSQPKINSVMLCILVDWLAEVAYMKTMSLQVLHAAVHYIYRFLTARVIERTKLQLLGIACLLLAAKSHYDPRYVHILTVRESSWLTDQTYQYEDVVKMLGELISAFKGDLWSPTSWDYTNLLLSLPEMDNVTRHHVNYIHDMSVQFTCFGGYKPSLLACASLMLARIILNQDSIWPDEYIEWTGFQIHDLANCTALVYFKCFASPPIKDDRDLPLKSIKEEYSSPKYGCIAMVFPTPIEIKNRILSEDTMLSCVSQDPLQFVVVPPDIDDTLNTSTKSIDYDGDCEDYNDMNTDSSSDEESFYVGRSGLSSYRSVDDFTDDDATMDGFNIAAFKWDQLPKTYDDGPDSALVNKDNVSESEKTDNSVFRFPVDIRPNLLVLKDKKPPIENGKKRRLKRKANVRSGYPRRKRTRSNTYV